MKVIVFSNNTWDDTNATGNTLSNLFGGKCWGNDKFYNIYMRDSLPNNKICNSYYRISLTDMIKHFFSKEKIGYSFIDSTQNFLETKQAKKEKKLIDLIHKYSINIVYFIADVIYRNKKWINKKFINYIQQIDSDIFYAHVNNFAFLSQLVNYMKNNTHAKVVVLLTDNLYEDIETKSVIRRKKLRRDFWSIIENSDKIYAISDELKEAYSKIFNKKIDILRKGCLFEYPIRKKTNDVIKFVYAGNLLYGRDEILSKVGQAIYQNNLKNSKKAILEIYTGDTINDKIAKKLNINNCSIIMGKRPYDEIKKIINAADYVLQVESFEKKQIDYVKYSFSTKIIDYLQSGSCCIGIGPNEVSSIKYLEKVPGSFTITDVKEINNKIIDLINCKDIVQNSKLIRDFALQNHDLEKNQEKLRNDFEQLSKLKGE